MELKDTLRAISDDARGWLKAWARDFTEEEARRPSGDGRAPNPLASRPAPKRMWPASSPRDPRPHR
jgi:hypothetical protein